MPSKSKRLLQIPPLSDPRITLAPKIAQELRLAIKKQSKAVRSLLQLNPQGNKTQKAIDRMLEGIKELVDLAPQIDEAIYFAVNAGWRFGSERGVSEQNTQSIRKRHQPSNKAKEKLLAHWSTGKWKTKVSCVNDNYEALMREVGLWKVDADKRVPSEQTLIRWLQKQ